MVEGERQRAAGRSQYSPGPDTPQTPQAEAFSASSSQLQLPLLNTHTHLMIPQEIAQTQGCWKERNQSIRTSNSEPKVIECQPQQTCQYGVKHMCLQCLQSHLQLTNTCTLKEAHPRNFHLAHSKHSTGQPDPSELTKTHHNAQEDPPASQSEQKLK